MYPRGFNSSHAHVKVTRKRSAEHEKSTTTDCVSAKLCTCLRDVSMLCIASAIISQHPCLSAELSAATLEIPGESCRILEESFLAWTVRDQFRIVMHRSYLEVSTRAMQF